VLITLKELRRAELTPWDRSYVVAVRPHRVGRQLTIALLNPFEIWFQDFIKPGQLIQEVIRSNLCHLDKMGGMGGQMADSSRHRGN